MMNDKRWLVVFCAVGLLGITSATAPGCAPASCESVCEGLNACEGQPQTPDCAAACEQAAQTNADIGCTDAYDALLSCQGTIDVCSSDTFCTGQSAAYLQCINDACSKDPSKCSGS